MPHQTSNKRRPPSYYQPSITNFFYSANSSSTTIPSNPLPINNTPVTSVSTQPRLPSSTQQGLLQVGMRVRKSIAEGYKQKTPSCDDYGYTRAGASVREAFYNPRTAEENEPLPGSQDSSFSSISSFSHGTKRRQEDSDSEDDDDVECGYGRGSRVVVGGGMEGGVGTQMLEFDDRRDYVGEEQSQWILPPTTFLPSPAEFVPGRNGRKVHAMPNRSGVQGGFGGRNVHVPTMPIMMAGGGGSGMDVDMVDDFGEASFLRPVGDF